MNIYDISQKSGVSIATVSRVLNNSKNVSEKTRKKVLAVMEQESYQPNAFARGLMLNTMQTSRDCVCIIMILFYAAPVMTGPRKKNVPTCSFPDMWMP